MDYVVVKKVNDTLSLKTYNKKVNGKKFWKLSILKNILFSEVFELSLKEEVMSFVIFNKKSKVAHYFGEGIKKQVGYKYLKLKDK